jgi:hypothetical protein
LPAVPSTGAEKGASEAEAVPAAAAALSARAAALWGEEQKKNIKEEA